MVPGHENNAACRPRPAAIRHFRIVVDERQVLPLLFGETCLHQISRNQGKDTNLRETVHFAKYPDQNGTSSSVTPWSKPASSAGAAAAAGGRWALRGMETGCCEYSPGEASPPWRPPNRISSSA